MKFEFAKYTDKDILPVEEYREYLAQPIPCPVGNKSIAHMMTLFGQEGTLGAKAPFGSCSPCFLNGKEAIVMDGVFILATDNGPVLKELNYFIGCVEVALSNPRKLRDYLGYVCDVEVL